MGQSLLPKSQNYGATQIEIDFKYIQPGKPSQNAYIERFNRTYRGKVLDAYLFDRIDDVREITANFIYDYNHHRPHDSLGGVPPIRYRERVAIVNGSAAVGLRSASATPSLHYAQPHD